MCTIISVIALFLNSIFKVEKIFLFLYFFSFLLFSISIDGNYFGLWEKMFVFDDVYVDYEVYGYWFFYLIAFFLFSLLLANTSKRNSINEKLCVLYERVDAKKLKRIGYFLAFISVGAGVFNLMRVGDYNLLFTNPREWERRFGQYFILNYIYFLHPLSIVCVIFSCKLKNKFKSLDILIIAVCVLSSTFHGIKFTVIHAFSFMIFSIFICNGLRFEKSVVLSLFILFVFFICFFTFVRGGGGEGIVNYITSASVNSIYEINNKDFTEAGDINNFFPFFDPEFYSKLVTRVTGGGFVSSGVSEDSGFYLNNKYNLTSAITKLSVTGPFGFVFWSCLYAFLLRCAYRLDTFFKFNFFIFLLYVLLMMFTAWEFYKYKLIFIIFVSFLVSRSVETQKK